MAFVEEGYCKEASLVSNMITNNFVGLDQLCKVHLIFGEVIVNMKVLTFYQDHRLDGERESNIWQAFSICMKDEIPCVYYQILG